jgi:mannose-6-phosphate isomerase-like protein (cupin superfamily)
MSSEQDHLPFENFRWKGVEPIAYKEGIRTFQGVTRQNIISREAGVDFEVRYFECESEGFTTLEKHEHVHVVMIARGSGNVVIGNRFFGALPFDFFVIPSWMPHQLINAGDEPFGFFCSVNARRDTFCLLRKEEIAALRVNEELSKIIRIPEHYFDQGPLGAPSPP